MLRLILALLDTPEPLAIAVHSLKVTMLAWPSQVSVIERDQRKCQGHHKLDCADVYGHDDTLAALRVQLQVLSALSEGWRPALAQERGAAPPLEELECSVVVPSGLAAEYSYLLPWSQQKPGAF